MLAAAQEQLPGTDECFQGKVDAREFPHDTSEKMTVISDQRQHLGGVSQPAHELVGDRRSVLWSRKRPLEVFPIVGTIRG
jgi:hypothetical protein